MLALLALVGVALVVPRQGQAQSSSMLSTASTSPFGMLLTAAPCTGPTCQAVINTCSGANCHDVTNTCTGQGCTLPVYVNTQVPACLEETISGTQLGCFPAGISSLNYAPAPTGSFLTLTAQDNDQFLAALFVSSAPPPTPVLNPKTSIPAGMQPCAGIPPASQICDAGSGTCTLQKSISVTSSRPTNCSLPYPYPLNLNGYGLQGDANTQIFFNNTIRNATPPHPGITGNVAVTNVTVILADLVTPAFDFSGNSSLYPSQFSGVTVYNGGTGILAANGAVTVLSSSFFNSAVGISITQTGNLSGRLAMIAGSNFQATNVGIQFQSDWPRDQFVTLWQQNPYEQCDASGNCYQDPIFSAPRFPPDFASPPVAPYTRTYPPNSQVWYPSGLQIIGNLFSGVGQYAANIAGAKQAFVTANQVQGFAGTAFRVSKSKNPNFYSNVITTSDTVHATVGIDIEYCDYQAVTRNNITAATGIALHNYGGKFRNSSGIYYDNISAVVGVEGVWDQVNTTAPFNSQEPWTNLMVDNEVGGNNFSSFGADGSPFYTPGTSFANQVVANVPSLTVEGQTASYPIYPYDRIFDPFTQVLCGRTPNQRVNHLIPIIEASPKCSLAGKQNVGSGPTWVGNHYDGRMNGNVVGYKGPVRALSDPYPNRFYNIPVWTMSAPFNMCFFSQAQKQNGLSFSSLESDYMPSVNAIPYAGVCSLGGGVTSLGDLLPGSQPQFPPAPANAAQYSTYAHSILNRTGQDNCDFTYPRAEFPNCSN